MSSYKGYDNPAQSPGIIEPYFTVSLNGKYLPDYMLGSIETLDVVESRTEANECTIKVQDYLHMFLDSDIVKKGVTVSVRMGTRTYSEHKFKGKIVGVDAEYPEDGKTSLTIQATDMNMEEADRSRKRTFKKKTMGEIFRQMIKEMGMTPIVDYNGKVLDKVVQNDESNMDFIKRHTKKLKLKKYKVRGNKAEYYIGKKPYLYPKPLSIGYKDLGHEVRSATPSFVDIEED